MNDYLGRPFGAAAVRKPGDDAHIRDMLKGRTLNAGPSFHSDVFKQVADKVAIERAPLYRALAKRKLTGVGPLPR